MTEPAAQQIPSPAALGAVTLIEGTAFCVCLPSGDIVPDGTDGVFYRDTRLVSRWELWPSPTWPESSTSRPDGAPAADSARSTPGATA